jgi:threonine dehydrogenase-like Zn-dependent dehydrogenase
VRALVYTPEGDLRLSEVAEPTAGAGETVVEVCATGICGSELEAFRHPDGLRKPPLVMGHEIAAWSAEGELVVVNPLLSCGRCAFCRSERRQLCRSRELIGVHRPGGFAERVVVPATSCYRVAQSLPPAVAVLVEPIANAIHAVRMLNGKTVASPGIAVIGSGAIGLAVALAALHAGHAAVSVVDPNHARLDAARDLPVDTATALHGEWEAIIDAVGLPETRAVSVDHLVPGGIAVWIGLASSEAGVDGRRIVRNENRIVGSYAYEDRDFVAALELAGQAPRSWIDTVPLEQAAERFVDLAAAPGPFPKTVIVQ